MPVIKIKNLYAGYGAHEVLRDVNIDIQQGSITLLIGRNGSGKSTVFKSIMGVCKIHRGEILYHNHNIIKLRAYQKMDLGIFYIPQTNFIFERMTVKENLEVGSFATDKNVFEKRLHEVYSKIEFLKNREKDLALKLSGGQQQLLALARVYLHKPKLILADEPTKGLSPKNAATILQKLVEFRKSGATIFLIEQNVESALDICDKLYLIKNGEIILHNKKITRQKSRIMETIDNLC